MLGRAQQSGAKMVPARVQVLDITDARGSAPAVERAHRQVSEGPMPDISVRSVLDMSRSRRREGTPA